MAMQDFYKITNKCEKHYDFQYKDGLNELEEPFDDDATHSCVKGGLYITTLQYIVNFYEYGVNLRKVILPVNDPEFKIVKDPQGNKWRVNKLILGEKYSLYDPKTYELFGLDISDNNYIIRWALAYENISFLNWWIDSKQNLIFNGNTINMMFCAASKNGKVKSLQWLKKSSIKVTYDQDSIDLASASGHANVLDWWLKSGLELKYSSYAMNTASENGHIYILEWWKNSGLKLDYTHDAIKKAINKNNISLLEWWIYSGLTFSNICGELDLNTLSKNQDLVTLDWWKKYNFTRLFPIKRHFFKNIATKIHGYDHSVKILYDNAMNQASNNGNIKILEWWKNSGLPSIYSEEAIDSACGSGHVDVLNWWMASGLPLKYSKKAIDLASGSGHVDILDRWLRSGLELKYSDDAMDNASGNGRKDTLNWWFESNLEIKYSKKSIHSASQNGHVHILEWWKITGMKLDYSHQAMDRASADGHIDLLDWWKNSGLKLKYSYNAMDDASGAGRIDILDWWKNSGLELKYSHYAMKNATCHGHLDILKWWHESGLKLKYFADDIVTGAFDIGRDDIILWFRTVVNERKEGNK